MATFDKVAFWSRLRTIHEGLKSGQKWNEADSFLLPVGKSSEDDPMYSRATATQLLLFGYQLPNSLMMLSKKGKLTVITVGKYARMMEEQLGLEDGDLSLELLAKNKQDNNAENFKKILAGLKESGLKIGTVKKHKPVGKFITAWNQAMAASPVDFEEVDCSVGLAMAMAVKDKTAYKAVVKAGAFSAAMLKRHLQSKVMDAVDEEKKVTHQELSDKCEDMFAQPGKVASKLVLDEDQLESCYAPIVQSGGVYDLKPSAQSDESNLHAGTIVLRLGARYQHYCTNVGRTYFVDPSDEVQANYGVLTSVYQACLGVMRSGKKLSDVYATAVGVIKRTKPELLEHFTKNCGFGMGLEFRESSWVITGKNQKVMKPGMVFNLSVGFEGLEDKNKSGRSKTYAMLLSDTVCITLDEAEVLTNVKRAFNQVAFFLDGESEESSEEEEGDGRRTRGVTKDRLRKEDIAEQERLAAQQRAVQRKKNEQMLRKFAQDQVEGQESKGRKNKEGAYISYTSPAELPQRIPQTQIYVDVASKSVLLPINDSLVPFHVNTIKNVHMTNEIGFTYLRINFHTPDQANTKVPKFADKKLKFIRELTYRTKSDSLDKAGYQIKALIKKVQEESKAKKEEEKIVKQPALKVDPRGALAKLRDLSCRPTLSRRKAAGMLAAHSNGFRYTSTAKDRVDIIYSNIKLAFVQLAEKDNLSVLIHFHLKNPIAISSGKKKKVTDYFQFYVEVVDSSQDVGGRSSFRDEDGLMEEQEERRNRNRWNERFLKFTKKVQDATDKKVEFDAPFTKMAFHGNPGKGMAKIIPAANALVALEAQPPLVLPVNDIEVVNFERVQFNLREFDIAFVNQDFSKDVVKIDSVPTKYLQKIKDWLMLGSIEIPFYESAANLNWKMILKHIEKESNSREDFYKDGGWAVVLGPDDGMDDDEEGDVESDESEYVEESSAGEDSEEYGEDSEEYEESDEESEEMDSEDEGEDWEELERSAAREDKESNRAMRERERREKEEKLRGKRKGSSSSSKKKKKQRR